MSSLRTNPWKLKDLAYIYPFTSPPRQLPCSPTEQVGGIDYDYNLPLECSYVNGWLGYSYILRCWELLLLVRACLWHFKFTNKWQNCGQCTDVHLISVVVVAFRWKARLVKYTSSLEEFLTLLFCGSTYLEVSLYCSATARAVLR